MKLDIGHAHLDVLHFIRDTPNASERDILRRISTLPRYSHFNSAELTHILGELHDYGLITIHQQTLYQLSAFGEVIIGKTQPNMLLADMLKKKGWDYPITHDLISRQVEQIKKQINLNNQSSSASKERNSNPQPKTEKPLNSKATKGTDLISDLTNGRESNITADKKCPPARKSKEIEPKLRVEHDLELIPEGEFSQGDMLQRDSKQVTNSDFIFSSALLSAFNKDECEVILDIFSKKASSREDIVDKLILIGAVVKNKDELFINSELIKAEGTRLTTPFDIFETENFSEIEKHIVIALLSNRKTQLAPGRLDKIVAVHCKKSEVSKITSDIIEKLSKNGVFIYRNNNMFYATVEFRMVVELSPVKKQTLENATKFQFLVTLLNFRLKRSEKLTQKIGASVKFVPCDTSIETNIKKTKGKDTKNEVNAKEAEIEVTTEETEVEVKAEEAEIKVTTEEAEIEVKAEEAEIEVTTEEAEVEVKAEEAQIEVKAEEAQIEVKAEEAQIEVKAEEAQIEVKAEEAQIEVKAEEAQIEVKAEEGLIKNLELFPFDIYATQFSINDAIKSLEENLVKNGFNFIHLREEKMQLLHVLASSQIGSDARIKALLTSMISDYKNH